MRSRRALRAAVLLTFTLAAASLAAPASAFNLVPGTGGSHGHDKSHEMRYRGQGPSTRAVLGAQGSGKLTYHGGASGLGVVTATPKVYLVFWGSQWGTRGTDASNYTTFSNDPRGMAPILQRLFAGLGTSAETWSGVMTESCQGVAVGATVCPSTAARVKYPTGGALGGVVYDQSVAPLQATDAQIAQVAVNAATTLGNTTPASNAGAQYFVVSPTGLHPGGFNAPLNWCAWHDWNGNYFTSPAGPIMFTNLPYLTDVGSSCGANYINAGTAGLTDGISIVAGHEYAETLTDPTIAGWYDAVGYENSDKCAWIGVGGATGAGKVTLSTGVFPMQSNFSNVTNACAIGAPTQVTLTSTVTFPAATPNQTGTVSTAVTPVTVTATSSNPAFTVSYAASGLPAGLTINATTGVISGTPTTSVWASPVTITATNTEGAKATQAFTWTVNGLTANTVTVTPVTARTTARAKAMTAIAMAATDSQAGQKFTWTATGLPTGVTINATTGAVTGTPSVGGTFTATVTATDLAAASGSTTLTIYVASPTVTNPGAQSTARRTVVSLPITATDVPTTTLTYSATGLPTGLSINATTGVISGTTGAAAQTKSVTVTARDAQGVTGTAVFTWSVV